jgi:hypothetical protein
MPKASRETASESIHGAGFEGLYEDFDGGYTVGFETFTEDVDMTPRLQGLPGDRCPCPHWGYVVKGKLTYKHGYGDEIFAAGDAFYVPAGHTVVGEAGTELVFFSPTREWEETLEKISKQAPQHA